MNIDTSSYGSGNIIVNFIQASNIVRTIRENFGLTQAQLAKKLRVSQAYIAQVEKSSKPVSLKLQIKLAKALGGYLEAPKFGFML